LCLNWWLSATFREPGAPYGAATGNRPVACV
jgi:hypothetical protein